VLGVLDAEGRQLVLADIPGLIEGASEGAGLGHEFLAHVERCRVLVHMLDLAPADGSDPVANHATVEDELRRHGAGLAELPRVLCLSKADLVPPEEAAAAADRWRGRLGDGVLEVVVTSAATGEGLDDLRAALVRHVPELEPKPASADADADPEAEAAPLPPESLAEHRVFRPADDERVAVERLPSGAFRVSGRRVERLVARHDTDNEEALRYLEERLRHVGVIRALEEAGFQPGDDVEIAGVVFELDPGAPFR
jgi:GTP-binding protein